MNGIMVASLFLSILLEKYYINIPTKHQVSVKTYLFFKIWIENYEQNNTYCLFILVSLSINTMFKIIGYSKMFNVIV